MANKLVQANQSKIEPIHRVAISRGVSRLPDDKITANTIRKRRFDERNRQARMIADVSANSLVEVASSYLPEPTEDAEKDMANCVEACYKLLAGHGVTIMEKLIQQAEAGNLQASQLLVKHLLPQIKQKITLDNPTTAEEATGQILTKMSKGELDLEASRSALDAIRLAGEVSLSTAMIQRFKELENRLKTSSSNSSEPITLEALPIDKYLKVTDGK